MPTLDDVWNWLKRNNVPFRAGAAFLNLVCLVLINLYHSTAAIDAGGNVFFFALLVGSLFWPLPKNRS